MFTDKTREALNRYLAESMQAHGLTGDFRVDCAGGSNAEIAIPIAYARENREGLLAALGEFLKNPLVAQGDDIGTHIDDPSKLGDDEDTAWCLFDVSGKDGDNWYLSDEEKESIRQAEEEDRREAAAEAALTDAIDKATRRLLFAPAREASRFRDVVYSPLKYEWFDRIASGEKTVEYKSLTRYWLSRLVNGGEGGKFTFPKYIRFQRGYGGPGRPRPEQMTFEIKAVVLSDDKLAERPIAEVVEEGFEPAYFAIVLGKRIS